MNHYEVLGVDKNATQDEIKKTYRTLSKKYHPDRNKDEGAEEMFKKVSEAYSILKDEKSRKEYDDELLGRNRFNFHFSGGNGNVRFHNFRHMNIASDIEMRLKISLEDAYYGCQKGVRIGAKQYKFTIPKGVRTGQELRMKGVGERGIDPYTGEERVGDLIITIIIVNNKDNIWLNDDGVLEVMYPIKWTTAILGGEEEIDVFDKKVRIKIPKYTQNGDSVTHVHGGFPYFKQDTYGPLKVDLIIKMPQKGELKDDELKMIENIENGGNQ